MRVIAGRLGGRRLQAPRGRVTRPTSDRVREALFAMLGSVDGASVLDLFAGTGALGIEALSRGAESAVFVERDARVASVLSGNLTALGITGETAEVRRLGRAGGAAERTRSQRDIRSRVHRSPLWTGARLGAGAVGGAAAAAQARRARRRRERPACPARAPPYGEGAVALERERHYGDTSITIHRHQ